MTDGSSKHKYHFKTETYCTLLCNAVLCLMLCCVVRRYQPATTLKSLNTVQPRQYGHQWAQKIWSYLRAIVLTKVLLQRMYGPFAGRPKKVAVITRWPYYRGGRKAGFHCTAWTVAIFRRRLLLSSNACRNQRQQVNDEPMIRNWYQNEWTIRKQIFMRIER